MEKVREKNTAWRELFKDFFSEIEKEDEENEEYKKWVLENSSDVKKTEGAIKKLEKIFGHPDNKEKIKKSRSDNNIESTKTQYHKTYAQNEAKKRQGDGREF